MLSVGADNVLVHHEQAQGHASITSIKCRPIDLSVVVCYTFPHCYIGVSCCFCFL